MAGRFGEIPAIPGALAYGDTEPKARANVSALALRVIADCIEHGEDAPVEALQLFAACES